MESANFFFQGEVSNLAIFFLIASIVGTLASVILVGAAMDARMSHFPFTVAFWVGLGCIPLAITNLTLADGEQNRSDRANLSQAMESVLPEGLTGLDEVEVRDFVRDAVNWATEEPRPLELSVGTVAVSIDHIEDDGLITFTPNDELEVK